MAVVIDASVGGVASNSFLTLTEMQDYMTSRLTIDEWDNADDPNALIVMGCRVFEAMFQPRRVLMRDGNKGPYYRTSPTWTGTPATNTQALSWPRLGMKNRNGGDILSTVNPQELKNAQAELVAQLAKGDRTLDNDVIAQGLTSLKAGSVALTFKQNFEFNTIPEAVWNLLVQSWLTDELFEYAASAEFFVIPTCRSTSWR